MTAAAQAKIGNTAWYLTEMLTTPGSCDHCGRALKHLYRVVNPGGEIMTVGRGCVKKLTGWTLEAANAVRILRLAQRDARRATAWATFSAAHPEVANTIHNDVAAYGQWSPTAHGAGASHEIRDLIRDGVITADHPYIASYLRRRGEFGWVR